MSSYLDAGNRIFHINELPLAGIRENDFFRPDVKKFWDEKTNKWFLVHFFHNGTPSFVEPCKKC